MTGGGDWLLVQELLDRGDPEFVDRLRALTDADALGRFAERWYANPSPSARRLLLAYLERPLNAYRHEALIKRLFKLAEQAGDDRVMARFLVLFDRSIRRVQSIRTRVLLNERVNTQREAEALVAEWHRPGVQNSFYLQEWTPSGRYYRVYVIGQPEPYLTSPGGTTMPRGTLVEYPIGWDYRTMRMAMVQAPDWMGKLGLYPGAKTEPTEPTVAQRKKLEERFRLFSLPTRQYLRRRAWRYFRRLGQEHPERYVAAISEALVLYQDADIPSGLALIDNWGLIHALFHHSPVLVARPRGWRLAEGRSLAELEPSPIFDALWRSSPKAIFDLIARARSRPVRQWAMRMFGRDPSQSRAAIGTEDYLGLLGHEDPDVVAFAVEGLRQADDLATVPADRWIAMAESASPAALEWLAGIMERQVAPERIPMAQAVRLTMSRPIPLARLGLHWLRTKTFSTDDDRREVLALLEAACEPVRAEILAWLRAALSSEFRTAELLEFLDSRYADARAEGMAWFRSEPRARDDVTLWQRLMESPYDDVRLALTGDLDARLKARNGPVTDLTVALDPDRLRLLWASVLLNVNRGSRAKPGVVEQVAHRLGRRPDEAALLLPILALGLRSVRAPERRAALAAVVGLVERRPDTASIVQATFPELQWA